jgi:hypothetical protein
VQTLAESNTVDISDLNTNTIPGLVTAVDRINKHMDTKASVSAVSACVRRVHYEQTVTALGSSLDCKAEGAQLNDTNKNLQVWQ